MLEFLVWLIMDVIVSSFVSAHDYLTAKLKKIGVPNWLSLMLVISSEILVFAAICYGFWSLLQSKAV